MRPSACTARKRQAIVSALEVASHGAELEQELTEAQAEAARFKEELKTLRKEQAAERRPESD